MCSREVQFVDVDGYQHGVRDLLLLVVVTVDAPGSGDGDAVDGLVIAGIVCAGGAVEDVDGVAVAEQ